MPPDNTVPATPAPANTTPAAIPPVPPAQELPSVSYPQEQASRPPQFPKKTLLIILGIVALLIGLLTTLYFLKNTQENTPSPSPSPKPLSEFSKEFSTNSYGELFPTSQSPAFKNPPKIEFEFKLSPSLQKPGQIASAPKLRLQFGLNASSAKDLVKKLISDAPVQNFGENNYRITTQDADIVVIKNSGAFIARFNTPEQSLAASVGKPASIKTDQEAIQSAENWLKTLNLWEDRYTSPMGDPYPKNSVVYKRKSTPGVYYVEFHRGWDPLPILNYTGLLGKSLKQESKDFKNQLPSSLDIEYSSDGLANYQRADDFNTITVGINDKGGVVYLKHYIRNIVSQDTAGLKTFDQAFEELQKGYGEGSIVYPLGIETDFSFDEWKKLYPFNTAKSKEALVEDVELAYPEKIITEPQNILSPAYIFRGKATLDTGEVVNFVTLIDAAT